MEWYVFALLSAVIGGLISVANKKILAKMSVIDFSVLHSFASFIISLSLLPFLSFTFNPKMTFLIFVAAAFSALGFYFVNKALQKHDVSLVSPLRSFNPVILLILAVVFLGERLTALNIMGILLIAFGAYVLEARNILHKPLEPLRRMMKSTLVLLVFASAVFYGISSTVDKVVLSSYDLFSFVILIHFFLALDFLVINLIEHRHFFSWNKNTKAMIPLILGTVVVTFASRVLMLQAVALAFVSLVIAVKHTDSLISTFVGGQLFHEKHLKKKLMAAAVMFAGVLLVVLKI